MLAEQRLDGLVVTDAQGHPYAVLPESQVLRFAIPRYVQEDPSLARVYDEDASDRLGARLSGVTVRELLPDRPAELPVLQPDDTTVEIAALMARAHSPLVAIVENRNILGVVTASRLLERLLPPADT